MFRLSVASGTRPSVAQPSEDGRLTPSAHPHHVQRWKLEKSELGCSGRDKMQETSVGTELRLQTYSHVLAVESNP